MTIGKIYRVCVDAITVYDKMTADELKSRQNVFRQNCCRQDFCMRNN